MESVYDQSNLQHRLADYLKVYPQHAAIAKVAQFFIDYADGNSQLHLLDRAELLERKVGQLLRHSLDEVIDMPRTARFSLASLEKTEKTYIGTKVEIVFRDSFNLAVGQKLDLLIKDTEVDVKHTIGRNWTVPSEALGEVCILLRTDDLKSQFDFGLVVVSDTILNQGRNRDGKRSVSQRGLCEVFWLVKQGELAKNFFLHITQQQRDNILQPSAGARRLANLFSTFQGELMDRRLVECVARQKDYMKRLRGNGGARDILTQQGLVILWGGAREDKNILQRLGFKGVTSEHFVCVEKAEIKIDQR